jgi:hypothetical protein
MIFAKTQSIMKTGIKKYSKLFDTTKDDTQILVQAQEKDGVHYMMCYKWNPKMKVSFKEIMDVKIDLLGLENLASPFLRKSIDMYADYYGALPEEMNLFIFEKNEKVGLAVYVKGVYKELLPLEKQFERLGL